ncbi:MAG TPA: phage portal protein, partial [Pyrinomonadaceae bacterium]
MQASEIPAGTISVPAPRADTLEPTFVVPYRQYAYRDAAPTNGGYSLGPMNVGFRLSSANKDIVRERRAALVNAREADRNSTAIRSGITKRAIDMVGKNLRLQSMPNFEALGLTEDWAAEFANQWENEFSLWGDDPRKLNDASRHNNFGSQMFEVCRNTYGADGEAALIIRYDERRQDMYRAHMATFVEVINPVRISNREGLRDGLDYCQGKVLDEWGAYTALDIEVEDPSAVAHRLRWERVMRETEWGRPIGVHWFPRYLAGAQRAMPAILGMLRGNRMLDTFDDKLLEQAVKAAFMSIYIKTDATSAEALAKLQPAPSGATDPFLAAMNARFGLYDELNVEGQSLPVLAPGDDIAVADAKNTTPDTDSFRFAFERKFANHLGLGYARYSNDYSKTSFASIRAEFIDAWRMTYADRYDFCQSVPAQIALAHLEECIVRNKIILPPNAPPFYENMTAYAQCEFRGPGMGWVDPVKDVKGANLR